MKHHGHDGQAAQWKPELSLDEEFSVFDRADEHNLCDARGLLYGLWRDSDGTVRYIGIWGEQLAKFAEPTQPQWHGYPFFPVTDAPATHHARNSKLPKQVLRRMEDTGTIDANERHRLSKGDHI